jgi:methylenetetrahydrofolate dehydrogenase (NADP+)/methenyltetrahydrofolate cyclohydrolase
MTAVAATVIDGVALAERLRETIDEELRVLRMSSVTPGLATIMVGEDAGASAYERHVRGLAEGLDYHYVAERLPTDVELADVLATIGKLNADPRVTGVLVLRPLPDHLPEAEINATVDPRKDIEGQHPENAGLLALGRPRFVPSTPASCFYLLDSYARSSGVEPADFYVGKTLVVVGRSTKSRSLRIASPSSRPPERHLAPAACRARLRRQTHRTTQRTRAVR